MACQTLWCSTDQMWSTPCVIVWSWPRMANMAWWSAKLCDHNKVFSRSSVCTCVCVRAHTPHMAFLTLAKRWTWKAFTKLLAFYRGVPEFQVKSDLVVQANAKFANLAKLFYLECLLGLGYASISMRYVDKKSVVRPYLQDSPTDDCLTSCQIRGTFMRSCQPLAPVVRPPPSLLHPRLYGATPCSRPGGHWV